jgi:hypothetical protein
LGYLFRVAAGDSREISQNLSNLIKNPNNTIIRQSLGKVLLLGEIFFEIKDKGIQE